MEDIVRDSTDIFERVDVEIIKINSHRHRISVRMIIPRTCEQVWQVLTNYDSLANFIPNLSKSRKISQINSQTIIEQIVYKCFLKFTFSARVILEIEEEFARKLTFKAIDGDFHLLLGECWLTEQSWHTALYGTIEFTSKIKIPIKLLKKQIQQTIALNLLAISQTVQITFTN
jgi:ribosome-associated toxin RatA of RatAB toxin-antitoxin module